MAPCQRVSMVGIGGGPVDQLSITPTPTLPLKKKNCVGIAPTDCIPLSPSIVIRRFFGVVDFLAPLLRLFDRRNDWRPAYLLYFPFDSRWRSCLFKFNACLKTQKLWWDLSRKAYFLFPPLCVCVRACVHVCVCVCVYEAVPITESVVTLTEWIIMDRAWGLYTIWHKCIPSWRSKIVLFSNGPYLSFGAFWKSIKPSGSSGDHV